MHSTTRDFSLSLYRQTALQETQQAYAELLDARFEHAEHNSHVTFSGDGDDLDFLIDAFCNHALFLSIQQYREDGVT